MISRNLSSERVSPPLASGWWRLTSSLKRDLISACVAVAGRLSASRAFASSGLSGRRASCASRGRPERQEKKACGSLVAAAARFRAGAAVARAVRPGVGARLPGRPMADHAVLLVGLDLGVAHAVEVIVGGVELAHVIEAEQIILPLVAPAARRAMRARGLAALPLASRAPARLGAAWSGRTRTLSKYLESSFIASKYERKLPAQTRSAMCLSLSVARAP